MDCIDLMNVSSGTLLNPGITETEKAKKIPADNPVIKIVDRIKVFIIFLN